MSNQYFALWLNLFGVPQWAGPFTDNRDARKAVPADARSSVITRAIPMTSGERLEAQRIMEAGHAAAQ